MILIKSSDVIVTGGCGFIGAAMIRFLLDTTNHSIINIDKLTYAAMLCLVIS
ncbi:NAD-dependent epimerase/dehydratase family protein [Vibrio sp.]|nr:NAD-dependent epimerase/dehydratase family protein [Vibrio sp.]